MTCADDVNLIVEDIRTTERNADVLLNAFKDIGLAVNTGKTKYIEMRRNRGIIVNALINILMKKVKTFKYLLFLLANQNFLQEEIKCRLKAGNSCQYSVQTLVFLTSLYEFEN